MPPSDPLQPYRRKRHFDKTPEPSGKEPPAPVARPVFVVQKHQASHLHYDLRLEVGGVLSSWAVPKGPSLDPGEKRLAVPTEDHPLPYADFEGTIPSEEYGGGTVIVWDRGRYRNLRTDDDGSEIPMDRCIEQGRVEIALEGEKLHGGWTLVRTDMGDGPGGRKKWLLIKQADDHADRGRDITAERPESVLSGRTLAQVADRGG